MEVVRIRSSMGKVVKVEQFDQDLTLTTSIVYRETRDFFKEKPAESTVSRWFRKFDTVPSGSDSDHLDR